MGTLRKILFITLGLLVCAAAVLLFPRDSGMVIEESELAKPTRSAPETGKVDEIDKANADSGELFYIMLEENMLCAYSENEHGKKLLHSVEIQPLLMSDLDKEKLNKGIYTKSYEDLLLYFESYSS